MLYPPLLKKTETLENKLKRANTSGRDTRSIPSDWPEAEGWTEVLTTLIIYFHCKCWADCVSPVDPVHLLNGKDEFMITDMGNCNCNYSYYTALIVL
jgi:hypothetical protein